MSIPVQCPNPDCRAAGIVGDSFSGRHVKCKRCGSPFVAKPTFDGHKNDTKKDKPASNTNPFPALPTEFGRYRILRLLGRGGMGAVYLAQDSQLGRQAALKVPFFNAADAPQRTERFVREARSAAVLQHPNICTVYDAGQIDGRPFITMAYIEGKPLEEAIDPEAPMPQARAAEIVRKIALALEHAHHKGIVHRDLKPANVMMGIDGEPVVMDFGLAKRVADVDPNEAKLTRDGGLLGTPSYMAPEQVKGDSAAIGPATDVYALGVILFEMLTGRTPYLGGMTVVIGQILAAPAPPVKEFRPDVDSRLDAICGKAMAKASADRYPSMDAFAADLLDYLRATPATDKEAAAGPGLQHAGDSDVYQISQAPTEAPQARNSLSPTPREAKVPTVIRHPDGARKTLQKAGATGRRRKSKSGIRINRRWVISLAVGGAFLGILFCICIVVVLSRGSSVQPDVFNGGPPTAGEPVISDDRILGKWESVGGKTPNIREYSKDGSAKITIVGKGVTTTGIFKFIGDEVEWRSGATTVKYKVKFNSSSEMELSNETGQMSKYKKSGIW